MAEQDKIITEEEKKKLTEEVVTPILKESEKSMTEAIRTQKPRRCYT
jgi:DNA polymerase III delta prime subunit